MTMDDDAPSKTVTAAITCSECGEECSTHKQLVEHVSITHLDGWAPFQCYYCAQNPASSAYHTATVDQLQVHCRRQHPQQKFMKVVTPDADKERRLTEILAKSDKSPPAPVEVETTAKIGGDKSDPDPHQSEEDGKKEEGGEQANLLLQPPPPPIITEQNETTAQTPADSTTAPVVAAESKTSASHGDDDGDGGGTSDDDDYDVDEETAADSDGDSDDQQQQHTSSCQLCRSPIKHSGKQYYLAEHVNRMHMRTPTFMCPLCTEDTKGSRADMQKHILAEHGTGKPPPHDVRARHDSERSALMRQCFPDFFVGNGGGGQQPSSTKKRATRQQQQSSASERRQPARSETATPVATRSSGKRPAAATNSGSRPAARSDDGQPRRSSQVGCGAVKKWRGDDDDEAAFVLRAQAVLARSPLLDVRCRRLLAVLNTAALGSGSRGRCITITGKEEDKPMTPLGFYREATGRNVDSPNREWAPAITVTALDHRPLSALFGAGLLIRHDFNSCKCREVCSTDSAVDNGEPIVFYEPDLKAKAARERSAKQHKEADEDEVKIVEQDESSNGSAQMPSSSSISAATANASNVGGSASSSAD